MVWLHPKFLILYVYLAGILYVHFRGHERHGLLKQLTDHSAILAPYNMFLYLVSAVPNRPVVDLDGFPQLRKLTDNWEVIREEALALDQGGDIRKPERHNDVSFDSLYRRGWKRFYLKWYGDSFPSAAERCPRTLGLLSDVPQVTAAMFALLPPHRKLGRHRDPYAGALRYHLGLSTPNSEECRIWVDGVQHAWRDGQAFLFDETYIHWARNKTDTPRIILFCDVERPLRFRWAQSLNRVFARLMGRATRTENVAGEHVGLISRTFSHLYRVREAGLRLKAFSLPLYRGVKLILLSGIAYVYVFLI